MLQDIVLEAVEEWLEIVLISTLEIIDKFSPYTHIQVGLQANGWPT